MRAGLGRAASRAVQLVGLPLLLAGLLLPFVPLVLYAVGQRYDYPALVPQQTSLRGLRLLGDPGADILEGLRTSLLVAAAVTAVACLVGLSAGRALGLHRFRGRSLAQAVLLSPVVVPGIAVTLGVPVLFIRYHLDNRGGVLLVHLIAAVPYVTLVMASVYAGLDTRLEDQARTLGAGPVRTFLSVTLPAVAPGLAVAAFFAFLLSYGEYTLTLLVAGGSVKTLPLLLYAFLGGADTQAAAAVGLALAVPPLLLLALTARFLAGDPRAVAGLGSVGGRA